MFKITYEKFQSYKLIHDKNLMFLQFLSLFVQEIYTEIKLKTLTNQQSTKHKSII
jgi:hypothetical protein